jgi:hypothetical protein
VPGDDAHEVQDWLEELGVRQRLAGRWRYDERYLCSPQERLYWQGGWHEGLLPVQGVSQRTLEQYALFESRSRQRLGRRPLPCHRSVSGSAKRVCLPLMRCSMHSVSTNGWRRRALMTSVCSGIWTTAAGMISVPV